MLAAPPSGGSSESSPSAASPSSNNNAAPGVSGSGTADYVPLWTDNNGTLGNSAKIGINTTSPASTLDVKGGETVRGTLSLPATGTATASAGKNSQPQKLTASAYNNNTKAAVTQNFQWQAEPVGNNTPNPNGTLNLLFGTGSNTPSETGLNIASNGQIKFASGQTFPGTGTITGVTAGTDLTGGGNGGNVTLSLDTTKVPQLNAANTFTGNQTVNGNLTATGVVTGSSYQIGSNLFAFGSYANGNAFLGFAGNTTSTGTYNTASGAYALLYNTTGSSNTAIGNLALADNTTGGGNTATGMNALGVDTTGSENTASGYQALFNNTTGHDNTAIGFEALVYGQTGSYNTAVGSGALVNNFSGVANSAFGYGALANNNNGTGGGNGAFGYQALEANTTGSNNDAFGGDALLQNTTGSGNIAFGGSALYNLTSGSNNIAVGNDAGVSLTSGSNDIYIGNYGVSSESNVIRLGSSQTSTYIPGIYGATSGSGIEVFVNSAGQLGTYTSSRRFKHEITDMGTVSDVLMKLRPVSFYYKPELDHRQTRQ